MSLRASSCWPRACSGLMNSGVPNTMPSWVRMSEPGRISRWVTFARPKSSTLGKSAMPPCVVRKMFSGFRSRCTMPCRCASSSAPHTCTMMFTARDGLQHPFGARDLRQVLALEILHHDVASAVFELAIQEDARRVRMRKVAHRARFTAKARHQVRPRDVLRMQDLDRDEAVHLGLLGLVDRAHAAGAYPLHDAELPRDLLADVGR